MTYLMYSGTILSVICTYSISHINVCFFTMHLHHAKLLFSVISNAMHYLYLLKNILTLVTTKALLFEL